MSVQDPEKLPLEDLPAPISPELTPGKKTDVTSQEPIKQLGTERNPELLPGQPGSSPSGSLPLPLAVTASPGQPAPALTGTASQVQVPDNAMPQIADDVDLIEKEWVEKAKQIVAQTKNDPRIQSNELEKVKTAYQKKRFNREAHMGKGQ
jgi:hypothetical protein